MAHCTYSKCVSAMSQLHVRLANYPFRHSHDSLNKNPQPRHQTQEPRSGCMECETRGVEAPRSILHLAGCSTTMYQLFGFSSQHSARAQSVESAGTAPAPQGCANDDFSDIQCRYHESRSLIPMMYKLMFSHRHARGSGSANTLYVPRGVARAWTCTHVHSCSDPD